MAGITAESLETGAQLLSAAEAESTIRHVNGVRLHVVAAGDADAPLVVLLHGFPEYWYGWRHQIEPLVAAGYRVLVPDQRGYNLSEKPQRVGAYRLHECAQDIVDLIATEGRDSAHVVGHDWGGMVAWDLALRNPDRIGRLTVINAPHPTAYRQQLVSTPEQLRRSWYMVAFQLPRLPEFVYRATDYRILERALRETSAPDTFPDAVLANYRRAWDQDGALTGMLNWYRAAARHPPTYADSRIEPPTLIVWGEDDSALVPSLAVQSHQYCDGGRLKRLANTSHWVPHERPAQVTDLLLEHLSADPDATPGAAR